MRQAITTRFLSPTNFRAGRYEAFAEAGSLTLEETHKLGFEQNHLRAAIALAKKLGWDGCWIGGTLPESGYVFVFADDADGFMVAPQGGQ